MASDFNLEVCIDSQTARKIKTSAGHRLEERDSSFNPKIPKQELLDFIQP